MSRKDEVLLWLNELGTAYQLWEHEAAHTMEDCYALPFAGKDVTFCKNILLCNRQKTSFYYYIMPAEKAFRTASVSKLIGVSRLSFAPAEDLMRLMSTESGSLSPFGLLFDQDSEVAFYYDRDIRNTPQIAFHPCDNTATVVFDQDEFWSKVIPHLKHTAHALTLPVQQEGENQA